MQVKVTNVGRVFTARLERGERLLDAIVHIAKDFEIRGGFVNAIGALHPAEIKYFREDLQDYESLLIDEMVELLSASGSISILEGDPMVHLHVVVGRADGTTLGGHCGAQSTIHITGEVYIYETQDPIYRSKGIDSPVNLLNLVDY